jgi:hypothetical protein
VHKNRFVTWDFLLLNLFQIGIMHFAADGDKLFLPMEFCYLLGV